jgi:hypothetical protein
MSIKVQAMFHRFLKWLGTRLFAKQGAKDASLQQTGVRVRPPRARAARPAPASPDLVKFKPQLNAKISDGGPGKNVLLRSQYVREETGTHDNLKILEPSLLEAAEEETGIDPYNTGRFDRAKHWEKRFRN